MSLSYNDRCCVTTASTLMALLLTMWLNEMSGRSASRGTVLCCSRGATTRRNICNRIAYFKNMPLVLVTSMILTNNYWIRMSWTLKETWVWFSVARASVSPFLKNVAASKQLTGSQEGNANWAVSVLCYSGLSWPQRTSPSAQHCGMFQKTAKYY